MQQNLMELQPELSRLYAVSLQGENVPVYHTAEADYAILVTEDEKPQQVQVRIREPFGQLVIRPMGERTYTLDGGVLTLSMRAGDKWSVELDHDLVRPLFLLCSRYIPRPADATHVFAAGTVTFIGDMELVSGDTVYLEAGAVVHGSFRAEHAEGITITGNGLMVGTLLHEPEPAPRRLMMRFLACRDVRIQGVTMVDGPCWHVVPIACRQVTVEDVNIITLKMCGDGIDVVGSEDVRIEGCFIRTNDDCIVVKANRYDDPLGCKDARNILARNCVLWNAKCGNALEIGYETSCTEICDVAFEHIAVIHCQLEGWQSGGVFTIHNGDRGHVHRIRYSHITVEDAQEKLVDFKILCSKYSVDLQRGQISDITFEHIHVTDGPFPPSIIRGYESELAEKHVVHDIRFRDVTVHGTPVTDRINARMILEMCEGITFA